MRSARPPYTFTDDGGATQSYVEQRRGDLDREGRAHHDPQQRLHDSGNGLFVSSAEPNISRDILIEGNAIYDNGNVGSLFEHNTYTEALGITYQFNRFGPTQGGRRRQQPEGPLGRPGRPLQLDRGRQPPARSGRDRQRHDPERPAYRATFVYGNVLIEPDGAGNRQIAHYGGDSGTTSKYRKGTLHFYNNTLVSYRTDRTTLFRLSTNDERADARNNIFYVTAAGTHAVARSTTPAC